jgi:hypothetical protein
MLKKDHGDPSVAGKRNEDKLFFLYIPPYPSSSIPLPFHASVTPTRHTNRTPFFPLFLPEFLVCVRLHEDLIGFQRVAKGSIRIETMTSEQTDEFASRAF